MKMPTNRIIALIVVAVLIVGAIYYLQSKKINLGGSAELAAEAEIVIPELTSEEKAAKYDRAREFVNPSGFLNSDEFKLADHIGKKVILLDIWTYSCINCQRTLPYITTWDDKYRDEGLLIVGLHSPEFEFEKDPENVLQAMEQFGIKYPVVQDNDFGTWRAYGNRYWPRKYLIDIDGYIVYDHIGEGAYEETEMKIKELLAERAQKLGETVDIDQSITNINVPEAITDGQARSPETYFGAWRNHNFGNGDPGMLGGFELEAPVEVVPNIFYLTGAWNIHEQYAENARKGAVITYKYYGDKLFMVASSKEGATVRLVHDGKPIGPAAGADVDAEGRVRIQEEGLYKLVDNPDGAGQHTLEIYVEDPGLEIFTFTFG